LGYNYFFNTFGRELAFVRKTSSGTGYPGLNADFPPGLMESRPVSMTGFSGFGDSTEGHTTNRNKVTEFIRQRVVAQGETFLQGGGSIRSTSSTRWVISSRAAISSFRTTSPTGYSFADFLLGYTQRRSSGGIAVTKFRATSQAYYLADTWKIRSNMTFDLGVVTSTTPPWLDKNGTLMTTSLPFHDTTPERAGSVPPSGNVRIGTVFYENTRCASRRSA